MSGMTSAEQMTLAEQMMSPNCFAKLWTPANKRGDVWYSAPCPYEVGFITALTKEACEWERTVVRNCLGTKNKLIWC